MEIVTTTSRKRQGAFTLIELLITMTVLGVLMAVALPNLRSFIVSNRLSSNVNGFVGLLNYARSEAIVRNQSVLVCAKTGGSNACVTGSPGLSWGEYETQVFVDVDGTDSWTTGDILLKTLPAMDATTTQTAFKNPNATTPRIIKFGAAGYSQSALRYNINAVGDAAYEIKYGRSICISTPGRVKVVALQSADCT